jgi:transposase-like protein
LCRIGRTKNHNKKPKRKCQSCGRQVVVSPTNKYISQSVLEYIEKLLLEKIPLAGITRVTGVSKKWLQDHVNALYAQVPQQIEGPVKPPGKLTVECDEAWSFVNNKGNK